MFKHLPSHGIQSVLNPRDHMGTDFIMQHGDTVSEFTERLPLICARVKSVPCQHGAARPRVADEADGLRYGG
jgi:hypothetical protein